MTTVLAILLCIGAGLVGGVFFAFSTFVMQALAERPADQGIGAMQRINITVLNPYFLGVFMGTALLSVVAITLPALASRSPQTLWLLAAGALYVFGSFVVTIVCNVPRNDRLARLDAGSEEARSYWPTYVREWTRWNHVRAAASAAAAACAAGALAS